MKNNKSKSNSLSKLELTCGIAGILCPLPVIGEALLAGFFYPIIKQIPLFEEKKSDGLSTSAVIASLCTSALTRIQLYPVFYDPIMHYVQKFL